MRTLYVIRHAEPALKGVFIGRTDPDLSAVGAGQACALRLPHPIQAIYSSPLKRARQTAEALAVATPVVIVPELSEMDFGRWEGLSWTAIEAQYPGEAAARRADWFGAPPEGGESWPDLVARVRTALDAITTGPMPAALVAHLVVNAAIASILRGHDPGAYWQDYCEIREYQL